MININSTENPIISVKYIFVLNRTDIHDKKEECVHPPWARVHWKNWWDSQEGGPVQIIHHTQIDHEWTRDKVILFS